MSDTRTFRSPDLSGHLGQAVDDYYRRWQEARELVKRRRPRNHRIYYWVQLSLLILMALLVFDSWYHDFEGAGFFPWESPYSIAILWTIPPTAWIVYALFKSRLSAKAALRSKNPAHIVKHMDDFSNLVTRIEVWRAFMKAVKGLDPDDLAHMGQVALEYQEKLLALCERWETHLSTVGEAEIRVTSIHKQIVQAIPEKDIRELRNITTILGERDRPEVERRVATVVQIDEARRPVPRGRARQAE